MSEHFFGATWTRFVQFLFAVFLLGIVSSPIYAALSDLSADGKSDLIFRNDSTGQISAWLMNGSASTAQAGLVGPGNWTVTHTADFNGDGKADLLFRNDDGSVTLWLMNGLNVVGSIGLIGADPNWRVSHVGDFNGDGKADILWRNTNGAVTLWLMDGATVTGRVGLLGADPLWSVSHVADFNGDGKADILWRNTNGAVTVWLMNGAAVSNATGILGPDPNWLVSHVADLNGDGKSDLLWRNTNGAVTAWLMNGTSVSSAMGLLGPDPEWRVSHTGDFNGDGKSDLLWRHSNGAVTIWLMNGTSIASTTGILGPDPNWRVTHLGDYNGDGKADLLWRNTQDGAITMWLMNGTTTLSAAGILGASSWSVVPSLIDTPKVSVSDFPANDAEASRFFAQATFGVKDADIARLKQIGYTAWINEQLALAPQFSHLAQVKRIAASRTDQWQNRPGVWDINDSMWIGMVDSNDQLRQRMMFALSQIFVVSVKDGSVYYLGNGLASYVDMLYDKGFGNFRDLIESVTKSTAMGSYLSHIYNEKENPSIGSVPDQNYAREVMQLFTIGLWELNLDGTRKLDGSGNPIPTYGNADVVGASRVLTGWTFDRATTQNWDNFYGFWNYPDNASQERSMKAYPAYHSLSEKKFLGVTIPASTTSDPEGDLKKFLDRLFNHPNVGPFIGKQLIQRLVTSNPSPAYVTRVASAFNDNGSGMRGDMKAVIRAILLDPEARSASSTTSPTFGKVREPVVRMAHLMRTLKATRPADPDSYGIGQWLYDKRKALWQSPLGSPTVFNFYRPDFRPANSALSQAGLVAPEMQLINQSTVDDIQWFFRDIFENAGIASCCSEAERNTFFLKLNYSELLPLVATPDALLDRLNALFMSGQMSPELRTSIKTEMANEYRTGSQTSGIQRGLTQMKLAKALYVLLLSAEYVVQK
jgi:uncharacterized protein (DUF1800 family)